METRAFATGEPSDRDALLAAPVRWPRPARLAEELSPPSQPAAKGLASPGLGGGGDPPENPPPDRPRARTVATLVPGEAATVVVEVRSIRSRSVRRRGM